MCQNKCSKFSLKLILKMGRSPVLLKCLKLVFEFFQAHGITELLKILSWYSVELIQRQVQFSLLKKVRPTLSQIVRNGNAQQFFFLNFIQRKILKLPVFFLKISQLLWRFFGDSIVKNFSFVKRTRTKPPFRQSLRQLFNRCFYLSENLRI